MASRSSLCLCLLCFAALFSSINGVALRRGDMRKRMMQRGAMAEAATWGMVGTLLSKSSREQEIIDIDADYIENNVQEVIPYVKPLGSYGFTSSEIEYLGNLYRDVDLAEALATLTTEQLDKILGEMRVENAATTAEVAREMRVVNVGEVSELDEQFSNFIRDDDGTEFLAGLTISTNMEQTWEDTWGEKGMDLIYMFGDSSLIPRGLEGKIKEVMVGNAETETNRPKGMNQIEFGALKNADFIQNTYQYALDLTVKNEHQGLLPDVLDYINALSGNAAIFGNGDVYGEAALSRGGNAYKTVDGTYTSLVTATVDSLSFKDEDGKPRIPQDQYNEFVSTATNIAISTAKDSMGTNFPDGETGLNALTNNIQSFYEAIYLTTTAGENVKNEVEEEKKEEEEKAGGETEDPGAE